MKYSKLLHVKQSAKFSPYKKVIQCFSKCCSQLSVHMYQCTAKQRNRTNLILVSFFPSRSSLKPWLKLSHNVRLKCGIFSQYTKSKEQNNSELARSHKHNIYRKPLVTLRMKSTRIADLNTPSKIFSGDLYCHKSCHKNYIEKWKRTTSTTNTPKLFKNHFPCIKSITDLGTGFSLPDIWNMINQDDDADLKNNEIKSFLIQEFSDPISFCDRVGEKKSLSFSSSNEMQDMKNSSRNTDVVKTTSIEVEHHYLMFPLNLKIASTMHTSSSSLGKKQKFWTFFSSFLQFCLMSIILN